MPVTPASGLGALALLFCAGCSIAPFSRFAPEPYHGPPVEENAAALIGCYGISYTKEKIQPWSVFLDSLRPDRDLAGGRRVPGARRARTSRQTRMEGSFWRPIPGGFQLHTSDGLHGTIGDFVARGDSLVGRNFSISDMVIPGPLGYTRVVARREPCPAARDSALR